MSLQVGYAAPDFSYFDKDGNQKTMHSLKGKKIVFFFPKAFTPGCTKESISVQENYTDIKNFGVAEIFGISLDNSDKLDLFCNTYNFEYIMVSDRNGAISKSYGVFRNKILIKFSDRDTFVINQENMIEGILQNGLTGRKSELGLQNQGIEIKNILRKLNEN